MNCTIAIPKFEKDQLRKYMQSKYTAALHRAGAKAVWINTNDLDKAIAEMLQCDGLLLSGGEDMDPKYYGQTPTEKCGEIVPRRDEVEMKMLEAFFATGKPILGICRGEQLMNVYFGGALHQDIVDISKCRHNDYPHKNLGCHIVSLTGGTKLARIMRKQTLRVNSLHHQAAATVGKDIIISAVSADGIIEGIEHATHPFCVGVQWHPEHMVRYCKQQRRIFEAFVAACKGK